MADQSTSRSQQQENVPRHSWAENSESSEAELDQDRTATISTKRRNTADDDFVASDTEAKSPKKARKPASRKPRSTAACSVTKSAAKAPKPKALPTSRPAPTQATMKTQLVSAAAPLAVNTTEGESISQNTPLLQPIVTMEAASSNFKSPLDHQAAGAPNPRVGTSAGAVLDWLFKCNNPVNAQIIADAFRATLNKAKAEAALLELCESGHIIKKESGKAKVFWVNQDNIQAPSEAELSSLAHEVETSATEKQAIEKELNQLKAICKVTSSQKSISELRAEKAALEERVWRKQSELSKLRASATQDGKSFSEMDSRAAIAAYCKALRDVKKRRNICHQMLSTAGESSGKSPKQLMEEWALDMDEENNFDVNTYPNLPMNALPPKGSSCGCTKTKNAH